MTDALATVSDNRTRRRGNDWGTGLSPTIERARASREAKPQKPVAAIKPAHEVMTLASLPPGTIFRLVTDYQGVKEAFADRVEDLGVALTEVDAAVGLTRGHLQKLLSDSNAKWSRQFGFVSLGKALEGTGMMLAFIIDDERFAPIKAQMAQRKLKQKRQFKLLAPPSQPA